VTVLSVGCAVGALRRRSRWLGVLAAAGLGVAILVLLSGAD